jgi:hypothetical protein
MTPDTEVTRYINSLISGKTQVQRLSLRTAQQYRTVWGRFASILTPDEKADVSKIDRELPALTKRLEQVFPGVKNETVHAYAVGIARCITLTLNNPLQTTYLATNDSEVLTPTNPSLRTDPGQSVGIHDENSSLRAEIERLQAELKQSKTEVRQLKIALSALVEPGL